MGLYTNCKCDACGKAFSENDDVVICPECGTPQHRACYKERGACVHKDRHASGFEWERPEQEQSFSGEGTAACKSCGAMNPAQSSRCRICGAAMHTGSDASAFGENGDRPSGFDGYRAYTRDERRPLPAFEVDGVTSMEMADYLGPKAAVGFIPKFNVMLQKRAALGSWNFGALLFGPYYLFYRRINRIGFLLLALLAALYVPSTVYGLEAFKAYTAPEVFGLTLPYSQGLLDSFETISNICYWARLALHVYCGAQANTWLLDRIIDDITDMHGRFPENERGANYRTALAYRGRPALMSAILTAVASYGLLYVVISANLIPLLA